MFSPRLLLVASLLVSNSCMARTLPPKSSEGVSQLIRDIAGAGSISRQRLEQVFQTAFIEAQGTKYLRVFEAQNVRYGTLEFERISYKDPIYGANFGPRMTAMLKGKCLQRVAIMSEFKSLAITQTPNGHSMEEETVYSRDYPRGKLSFGFAEAAPDCLRSITIAQPK